MRLLTKIICSMALTMSVACSGSDKAAESTTFYPDSSVVDQASSLVTSVAPDVAAHDLVKWLADAPSEHREFSRSLAREVFRLYTTSGDSSALARFATSLEAEKDSLDLPGQVKVFVAVSKPSTLGRMLRNDPQGEKLAALISEQYAADSIALSEFTQAYKSE